MNAHICAIARRLWGIVLVKVHKGPLSCLQETLCWDLLQTYPICRTLNSKNISTLLMGNLTNQQILHNYNIDKFDIFCISRPTHFTNLFPILFKKALTNIKAHTFHKLISYFVQNSSDKDCSRTWFPTNFSSFISSLIHCPI